MKALYPGCSVTVSGGAVSAITLRPQVSKGKTIASAASLANDLLSGIPVTIGIVASPSKQEGRATEDGSTVTISSKLAKFDVSLGGDPIVDRSSTAHFISVDGSSVTLNPKAAEGAAAKIGVRNRNGSWSTLTITKKDNMSIIIEYHLNDKIRP